MTYTRAARGTGHEGAGSDLASLERAAELAKRLVESDVRGRRRRSSSHEKTKNVKASDIESQP